MNIFIAGFHPLFGNKELRELFEEYGEVQSASVVCHRDTGFSRCFGFVEMPDTSQAKYAIEKLDGKTLEGCRYSLRVNQGKRR